jgi:hypothetical protein
MQPGVPHQQWPLRNLQPAGLLLLLLLLRMTMMASAGDVASCSSKQGILAGPGLEPLLLPVEGRAVGHCCCCQRW